MSKQYKKSKIQNESQPIQFSSDYDTPALKCPSCGEANLHQEEVRVVFRDQNDGDGTYVKISRGLLNAERRKNKQIPGRRDNLHILFSCEQCSASPVLEIRQCKGNTFVLWVDTITARKFDEKLDTYNQT